MVPSAIAAEPPFAAAPAGRRVEVSNKSQSKSAFQRQASSAGFLVMTKDFLRHDEKSMGVWAIAG
jgi:hypothetical protein